MDTQANIRQAYMEYVLEHDTPPRTVFQLCKKAGIPEEKFYEYYPSLEGIDAEIWGDFFTQTKTRITAEEVYASYSCREKVLAFYYTLLEVLKANRSFVVYSYAKKARLDARPAFLHHFRDSFNEWIEDVLTEGRESQEIADRPLLGRLYHEGFWVQLLLTLRFWVRDTSPAFEKTDVFVEKAVNFAFDSLGRTAFDSGIDFFKYAFQSR